MPRRETLLMDQRVQFIADYQRDVFDVADLARRCGISRKTAYKWIDRYDSAGPGGLVDRSRRPAHCPHETPAPIVAALLEVRRHHPSWGAKKLLKVVATRQPTWTLPARSTVCDLLDRAGVIPTSTRRTVPAHPGRPLVPMTAPNGTWTADFKGQFKTRTGVYLQSAHDRRRLQSVLARVPGLAVDRNRHRPADLPSSVSAVRPARDHPDRQRRPVRDDGARPVVDLVRVVDSLGHPARSDRAGLPAAERPP